MTDMRFLYPGQIVRRAWTTVFEFAHCNVMWLRGRVTSSITIQCLDRTLLLAQTKLTGATHRRALARLDIGMLPL